MISPLYVGRLNQNCVDAGLRFGADAASAALDQLLDDGMK
jgi:hypothetical protein